MPQGMTPRWSFLSRQLARSRVHRLLAVLSNYSVILVCTCVHRKRVAATVYCMYDVHRT